MSRAPAALRRYREKRDFSKTPEPSGDDSRRDSELAFVVQRHAARRLHYDFRLEWHGTLKSWAVTRGPSMDPADKRLAVEVEDHPVDYGSFEGNIPRPNYGGGTVQLWDRGKWAPLDPATVDQDLDKGELKFVLSGERLRGGFVLVRMRNRRGEPPKRKNWLLIKERDAAARPGEGDAVLRDETSVMSGRTLDEIARSDTDTKPRSPMPRFLPPQLCKLVKTPPSGEDWVHELKLDGYRLQIRVESGRAVLRTRTGLDWTQRFPSIARAAAELPDCILDGEVVALDDEGYPAFSALQATLSGGIQSKLTCYLFDLLYQGENDVRNDPLGARKEKLRNLLPRAHDALRYLEHFDGTGKVVLASACKLSMEGIVSKRIDSPYSGGRGDSWTKAKCRGSDEFVVGGWTAGARGRGLGSLLVGARRTDGLVYLGRVGTGFSERQSKILMTRLNGLAVSDPPFTQRLPARVSGIKWVSPEVVVQIAYGGWTDNDLLRHASFQGIREDKAADDVVPLNQPRPAGKPAVTHPERVLWPATSHTPPVTKADLAAYYAAFAERILPYIAGRPLSLLRAPDGTGGQLFFQRHAMRGQSPLIGMVTIAGQAKPFMRIDDAAGLAALAQISAVELHPWGARAENPDVPDRLVFDFDPAENVPFRAVIDAALDLRERLRHLNLKSFPRVTGGKGIHVVVPLSVPKRTSPPGWNEAKQFAHLICVMMEHDSPGRYTTTPARRARTGKIFLDYLRNDKLATAIASWSPRGRPGAPIARPVSWSAVKPGLDPAGSGLSALVTSRPPRDPWTGFLKDGGDLRYAIERIARK